MSSDSDSGPVVSGRARLSFPQNGSWNMFDIAKAPFQTTMGILARYMAGRINPYTSAAVEQMCRQFQLSSKGRRNTDLALSKLKIVSSVGNILEIGFGIEDVIHDVMRTEAGVVGLVLCAALKECYHDNVAIDVLMEMARSCNVSGEFMPPSSAWRDWLNACAGLLAATDFPRRAEYLMQLPADKQRLGVYQRDAGLPKSLRSCSSPRSIADALGALASITRDELESVTFIGGADVGWLAAIAEWLFDLRITMVKDDGKVFYFNHENPDAVQVKVIFQDNDKEGPMNLQCVGRSYILKDMSTLLERQTPGAGVVSGRLEWKHALMDTFQSEFRDLMHIPEAFGELLGSASRIFKAVAQADNSFPNAPKRACVGYCDSSIGAGLVTNTIKWFPELENLRKHMQKAVRFDLSTATKTYERCISQIRKHCDCRTCQSTSNGFGGTDEMKDEPSSSSQASDVDVDMLSDSALSFPSDNGSEFQGDWDPDVYCQVVIAETIIYLSRVLSSVYLESDTLLPMRSGLERAYGRRLNQRRSANLARTTLGTIGQIAFCLDFDNDFCIAEREGNEEAVEIRLHAALELFSGQSISFSGDSISAATSNGIVAFLGVLQEPSADENAVGRIHVVPGRIYHQKKRYDCLLDRSPDEAVPISDFSKAENVAGLNKEVPQTLGVRESAYAFECILIFGNRHRGEDATSHLPVGVGPSRLAVMLASRRGLVSCKWTKGAYRGKPPKGPSCMEKRKSSFLSPEEAEKAWKDGIHHLKIPDKTITIIHPTNNATTIAAIASMAYLDPLFSLYLVSSECLQCCVRTAVKVDHPYRRHFCFLYLPHQR